MLKGSKDAREWTSVDLDLYAFSSIEALVLLDNGEVIASTGQMTTQGKTKPALFRSKDNGITWEKEAIDLPITLFQTFYQHLRVNCM